MIQKRIKTEAALPMMIAIFRISSLKIKYRQRKIVPVSQVFEKQIFDFF